MAGFRGYVWRACLGAVALLCAVTFESVGPGRMLRS